jgi:transposase
MPTTAKTLIRRVLELPLPKDSPVHSVGIDEWAWKKGSTYGTILVDLEHRRIADLLPERSVQSSTAWFKKHSQIRIVSRDRGKIFRAAANAGAPQAKQVVDRFHLQKNFAEALEKFFCHHKRLLKKVAQQLGGRTPLPAKIPVLKASEQKAKDRHAQRVIRHKKIWELFRAGSPKVDIARIVGVSLHSVYRALEQEQPPCRPHWRSTHHVVDPYVSYLTKRWNEGCHTALQLYQEVVAQGYTGSVRTIRRTVAQFRLHGAGPVTKQAITLPKAPSPRNVALMIIRPAQKRTKDQTMFIHQLCKSDSTAAIACTLAQAFSSLLHNLEGKSGLEKWKADVRASGIAELVGFLEGLTDDAEAVVNGCTESWNNGMVEGFINKVKWIKRSSYGQAEFPLLERRVLLHPVARETVRKDQRRRSSQKTTSLTCHGAQPTPMAVAASGTSSLLPSSADALQ